MPAGTCTVTTELLGFHPSRIGNEKSAIICDQLLLQLHRTVRIDIFGIVCNNGLRDSLTNGIYLRGVSSPLDTDADVNGRKGFLASNKNGLVYLETEDFRSDEVDW